MKGPQGFQAICTLCRILSIVIDSVLCLIQLLTFSNFMLLGEGLLLMYYIKPDFSRTRALLISMLLWLSACIESTAKK